MPWLFFFWFCFNFYICIPQQYGFAHFKNFIEKHCVLFFVLNLHSILYLWDSSTVHRKRQIQFINPHCLVAFHYLNITDSFITDGHFGLFSDFAIKASVAMNTAVYISSCICKRFTRYLGAGSQNWQLFTSLLHNVKLFPGWL